MDGDLLCKLCVTCNKPLERKRHGKDQKLETVTRWKGRTHCDRVCLHADPLWRDNHSKKMKQLFVDEPERRDVIAHRMALYAIDHRLELLAKLEEIRPTRGSCAPSKKRREAAQLSRDRWANGEFRIPIHIKRSRDEGKPYDGLDEHEIFAIQLDQRSLTEIAKAFSVSRKTIWTLKHKHDSFVALPGRVRRAVITPRGYFDNITLAAKESNISRQTAMRWANEKKNGWEYA